MECPLCFEGYTKNQVVLEPCGHICCESCAHAWSVTCAFCRNPIEQYTTLFEQCTTAKRFKCTNVPCDNYKLIVLLPSLMSIIVGRATRHTVQMSKVDTCVTCMKVYYRTVTRKEKIRFYASHIVYLGEFKKC